MDFLQKLFKSKFKQAALDGDSKYAKMNLEDADPNNLPPPLKICALTIVQIKDFQVTNKNKVSDWNEHLELLRVGWTPEIEPSKIV